MMHTPEYKNIIRTFEGNVESQTVAEIGTRPALSPSFLKRAGEPKNELIIDFDA
jgi:hypothetical protein